MMKKITLLVLLTIVVIFGMSQMVYADSSTLSVLPASLNSTAGSVFSISIQIDSVNNDICVVKGTLNFDNLSCQNIITDSGVMAMITPTCASPSFVLGIPKCVVAVQNILSVSAEGVQAGQGKLFLTDVNVIGAGTDIPFNVEGGAYNITAVNIIVPKDIQQDVEQQEQETILQQEEQEESTSNQINYEIIAQAGLLTGMMNILNDIWLTVILVILIILLLAILYFIKKKIINRNFVNKKFIYIIIGAVIIVIIGSWLILSSDFWQANVKENNVALETVGKEAVLVIDYGEENPKTSVAEFKEGMTAFDLLEEEAKKLYLALKTKNYDIGIFIEAIGDKENGQDGKYWLYYINGEMPMISADKMIIKSGDKVEFKFEKSTF
ncbi:DUF4430 domain-containing protein [Patescibacteria group bacterium]|nr:DUF4430 domain-containing protein [Patescibacteria group bacterium]